MEGSGGGGMGILTVIMVSGGVALLVLGRHKLPELNLIKPIPSKSFSGRSCLSSANNLRRKKNKKRVRFAAEVVEHDQIQQKQKQKIRESSIPANNGRPVEERSSIPANRLALYNGMLRYRMHQASLYR
ncbi:hypothetical protein KI387_043923 [Taxus chinensis]|uniref:Uncharacterized protein n=1 Tax=Taxus chinensis TaxID=29808 RepID=A0AA38GIM4_TAXCH|nr:hypothetical protein KI387_043923 [Taxus chinensis]